MKQLIICCCFIVLCFCHHFAVAQLGNAIQFNNINRSNSNLPEDHLNSTATDSKGFLWIGSNEGLFRYDGNKFKTWYAKPNDSNCFQINGVVILGEYQIGKIFFSSNYKIYQIDISTFEIKPITNLSNKNLVISLYKINNNLFASRDKDSIYFLNNQFRCTYSVSSKNFEPLNGSIDIYPLNQNYLFVNAGKNVFFVLNYETKDVLPIKILGIDKLPSPPFYNASQLYFDSINNRLYFTKFNGYVFYINPNLPSKTVYTLVRLPELEKISNVRFITTSLNGTYFQIGDNGLLIKNKDSINLYNKSTVMDKPMKANIAHHANISNPSKIWISTFEGLSSFSLNPSCINYCRINIPALADDECVSILRASNNKIYALFVNSGLYQMDENLGDLMPIKTPVGYCWSMMEENKELIITGAGSKIAHYNLVTKRAYIPNYVNQLQINGEILLKVFKAKNGDMIYCANKGGGIVIKPVNTSKYIKYNNAQNPAPFIHRHFHTIAEDTDGNIWFSYNRMNSLLKWTRNTNTFEDIDLNTLSKSKAIYSGVNALFIANNNLWILIENYALAKYNLSTRQIAFYDINNGLPANNIWGICSDGANRVWLSTNKGLSCYIPETDKFINFTKNDGLPEDDFPNNGIYFDNQTNKLFVGSRKTIASFNVDSLLSSANKTNLKVYIEDMLVNGKTYFYESREKIKLEANQNNISFSFAVPDFERNNELEFEYQLKGSSSQWLPVGIERTVTFNNLSSGEYILSVRAKYKGNEVWVVTDYPFTFTIKTPWYKTWWFYTLCAIVLVGLALFINRAYYLRKLEQQKAIVEKQKAVELERNRIAADMHDDLGSGLTRINYATQLAILKGPNQNDLLNIQNISTSLVENMKEIIWAMKDDNNNLEELLFYIKNYALEYCASHNINCIINAPDQLYHRVVKGQNRRHIYLTIKEVLHNIVKHAKATTVNIKVHYHTNWAITITDNGIGMPQENIKNGNGLKNMQQRMQAVKGTFKINSSSNGTTVVLEIPL